MKSQCCGDAELRPHHQILSGWKDLQLVDLDMQPPARNGFLFSCAIASRAASPYDSITGTAASKVFDGCAKLLRRAAALEPGSGTAGDAPTTTCARTSAASRDHQRAIRPCVSGVMRSRCGDSTSQESGLLPTRIGCCSLVHRCSIWPRSLNAAAMRLSMALKIGVES